MAVGRVRREPHITTRRFVLLLPRLAGTSVVFRTPCSRLLCSDDVWGPRVPGLTVPGLRPDAGACANAALFGGQWYGGSYPVPGHPPKGGVSRYSYRGCYIVARDPSPVRNGARVTH